MNKALILGLDIGGANTKAALVKFEADNISSSYSYIEYFPFWEKTLNEIPQLFKKIVAQIVKGNNYTIGDIDIIAVTITAELSDAFQTKREGINKILHALIQVFPEERLAFISNGGMFVDTGPATMDPLRIAAANWVSTALFLGHFVPNCILIDSGSTTIDIIPILDSYPVAKGYNDITRLKNHELIYTGGLRATIPSVTHFVPYEGKLVRIAFEKFALIADVHRILDHITEKEYINDTADNRSKSLDDCYARLARIICMDGDTISREELDSIANFIYEEQLEIVSKEIEEFMKFLKIRHPEFKEDPLFVITGLSAEFLIRRGLILLGYQNIKLYEEIAHIPDNITSSAFAVAGAFYLQRRDEV
jgi:probable H4MPT-linked C1 transfer pathway protein